MSSVALLEEAVYVEIVCGVQVCVDVVCKLVMRRSRVYECGVYGYSVQCVFVGI